MFGHLSMMPIRKLHFENRGGCTLAVNLSQRAEYVSSNQCEVGFQVQIDFNWVKRKTSCTDEEFA